jgi:hypothetical protein
MSKKYDRYTELLTEEQLSLILVDKKKKPVVPMKIDAALRRELRDRFIIDIVKKAMLLDVNVPYRPSESSASAERDRSIIAVVKKACMLDRDITYGEVLYYVDNDDTELEYERSKGITGGLGFR